MIDLEVTHRELLQRVAEQLANTPTATDHLMLTRWRVLSMCQYLLGDSTKKLEIACRTALDAFVAHGVGVACDQALEAAGAVIKESAGEQPASMTVLPSISREKRAAVSKELDVLTEAGDTSLERALCVLPDLRKRFSTMDQSSLLSGIRLRYDLVASILEDPDRSPGERLRAAAAVLYLNELNDVIPDNLGVIGLIDDDYALRIVLEEIEGKSDTHLHWSEKISSLWDDLPFLQGVNLRRWDSPISVTWLDRVNSFVSYSHVLGSNQGTLVLLQPSVACSPLHAIVSLIGLLVLDAVTTTASKAHTLREGTTYELDGYFVRFEGISGPPAPGWLRLRTRECIICKPPGLADRMVPVEDRKLSSQKEFSSRQRTNVSDPMQRFFDWDTAIGPASITSRLVLVSSRQRALDLLEGVESNGVRLLEHGLVRFMGVVPDKIDAHGALVLVMPSLSTARLLLDRGIRVQAILVDGYERLHRGRNELPFLINRQGAPPIINWSTTGYYPATPPTWLPPHKRLEVTSDDLVGILELDDQGSDSAQASLWEAATGHSVRPFLTPLSTDEVSIVESISGYLQIVRCAESLPEYWRYHLMTLARTLQILVTSTPAEWSEIKRFANYWSSSVDEKWGILRKSAAETLAGVRAAEKSIGELVLRVGATFNSRANGLADFLKGSASCDGSWYLVCDRPEQAKVAAAAIKTLGMSNVEPVLLRDLAVCNDCIVAGWVNTSFARKLCAHTPRTLVAVTDDAGRRRWERATAIQRFQAGQSLLEAVGVGRTSLGGDVTRDSCLERGFDDDDDIIAEASVTLGQEECVPCVFLWVTGESQAKVLDPYGRVVVEEGEVVREKAAAGLRPDDRVILGIGTSRWSPSDEFTEVVIDSVQKSHPQLITAAREWRRALKALVEGQRLSIQRLRERLSALGVSRKCQTLSGWLDLERSSPIAPRGVRQEITALWPLVEEQTIFSIDDVCEACARLRSLRAAAGRALLQLWKGKTIELDIDEQLLGDLVDRLRQEVHVYEVEAVTLGNVPASMLGWWIAPTVAGSFESDSGQTLRNHDSTNEDDL